MNDCSSCVSVCIEAHDKERNHSFSLGIFSLAALRGLMIVYSSLMATEDL